MWKDVEAKKITVPCPAPWFETFSQWQTIAEELKCDVPSAREADAELQQMALKAALVKQKSRPSLEIRAEQQAEQKSREREMRRKRR